MWASARGPTGSCSSRSSALYRSPRSFEWQCISELDAADVRSGTSGVGSRARRRTSLNLSMLAIVHATARVEANDKHGTRGVPYDGFGDASEQHALESRPPPRPDDDELGFQRFCLGRDR